MGFFVYMLRCGDGSLYVGQTDDVGSRMRQHEQGDVGYTASLNPLALVWQGEFGTRDEAFQFERRIKGWTRAKKEALIEGDWERVQVLARNRQGVLRQAQDERVGAAPAVLRQAQDERVGAASAVLRQAQDEGVGAGSAVLRQVQDEQAGAGSAVLRQAQDDRGGGAQDAQPTPVHPEQPTSVHPELVEEPPDTSPAVHPEPVEGSAPAPTPAHPEPVEGPSLTPADQALFTSVLQGHRRAIAKSITLLESTRSDHRERADALLTALLPHTARSLRLGISGVPGVGKSTFIEALGLHLIEQGHQVAVLAIDPSSSVSGGSILGDKTRMDRLSMHERAYIRPSPASGTLGGVAEKTREAMLVCEAAGYDIVIVETVGVGQSEIAVAGMTDLFVLLQLPNAGDDLQAIKKGVMELADLVVINKADIDPNAATRAQLQIRSAMQLLGSHGSHDDSIWHPTVMQISALNGKGIDEFWANVDRFTTLQRANGRYDTRRRQQARNWMWDIIQTGLRQRFAAHPAIRDQLPATLDDVLHGKLAASTAARELLARFSSDPST